MKHPLVVTATNLIKSGDIAGAERAFESLAETQGDHALVIALDSMPAQDLLAVVREYDSSKESIVNAVITAEQFAAAVVLERHYRDPTCAHLRGMINAVFFRDDDQTREFIAAIGDRPDGCETLTDYLCDHDDEVIHFATFDTFNLNHEEAGDAVDRDQVRDGDWMEVAWSLKHELPDLFGDIWPALVARRSRRLRLEAEKKAREQNPSDHTVAAPCHKSAAVQPLSDLESEPAL